MGESPCSRLILIVRPRDGANEAACVACRNHANAMPCRSQRGATTFHVAWRPRGRKRVSRASALWLGQHGHCGPTVRACARLLANGNNTGRQDHSVYLAFLASHSTLLARSASFTSLRFTQQSDTSKRLKGFGVGCWSVGLDTLGSLDGFALHSLLRGLLGTSLGEAGEIDQYSSIMGHAAAGVARNSAPVRVRSRPHPESRNLNGRWTQARVWLTSELRSTCATFQRPISLGHLSHILTYIFRCLF